MPCTTILVGKDASFDGSTIIARNDDAGSGKYMPKKAIIVNPSEQPRHYVSVLSHCSIDLPDNPYRYSALPNAKEGEGIWAACGINEKQVAMTATETITSNPRVLGADPLVEYVPAGKDTAEQIGGIGEEDFVVLTLPYINSAREGVKRLGSLLEKYGTYEMNGIAFSDSEEIWWMETIGGHHYIAVRVPDNRYVMMPNQMGINRFDLNDALGAQHNYMCSSDLNEFIEENHLDLSLGDTFDPRAAFGSHSDADHVYNTPRAWYMLRYFNPHQMEDHEPWDDDLPWSEVPERKITIEDIKYILSSHYQGTEYNPYNALSEKPHLYRPIGINRTDCLGIMQIREDQRLSTKCLEWVSFGCNVFNVLCPFYTETSSLPEYLSNTTPQVDTNNFFWAGRLIGALADPEYNGTSSVIERYQFETQSMLNACIKECDKQLEAGMMTTEEANRKLCDIVHAQTDKALEAILAERVNHMHNAFARNDQ